MKKLFENWNEYIKEAELPTTTRVGKAEQERQQQIDALKDMTTRVGKDEQERQQQIDALKDMGTRVVKDETPKSGQNKTAAIAKSVAASIEELEKVLQALKGSLQEARIDFSDLIVQTGNLEQGITGAYKDICEGVKSKTQGPIKVNWIQEEQKFLVVDGLHRLVEFIKNGEKSCYCEIDWNSGSDGWLLPSKEERFETFSLRELKKAMDGLIS